MKVCLQLWKQLHLHLPNDIWFCCMKPSLTQKLDKEHVENNNLKEVINCDEIVKIRKKLLNGDVPRFCSKCGNLNDYDTYEDFVNDLYKNKIITDKNCSMDDLCRIDTVNEVCIEFTTRCNFKCIYCLHSNPVFDTFQKDIDVSYFYEIIDLLVKQLGIKELTTIGIGEFTLIDNWSSIIDNVIEKYPSLKINLFSNFGKVFSEDEINALAKVSCINISCDTEKWDLFKKLRSGNIQNVVYNITRLKAAIAKNKKSTTIIRIAVVLNTESIVGLEDFIQYLISNNLCNEVMLSPMNLPDIYSKKIGIYPLSSEDEDKNVKQILSNVLKMSEESNIKIFLNGELEKLVNQ